MYHQFKHLADIDITQEPMEVGPTTHYIMGGIRVDPDSQMCPTAPGLFAAGECAGGLHGANRLGGNSLSDLLVFGKLAGEHAAIYAKENSAGEPNSDHIEQTVRTVLAPFDRENATDAARNASDPVRRTSVPREMRPTRFGGLPRPTKRVRPGVGGRPR